MLTINWKQVYEVELDETKQWVLIIYDISGNHYVGIPVYSEEKSNSIFIKSINKYLALDEIYDYNRTSIKRCIYLKGKPLKITNKEFEDILLKSKINLLNYVKYNTNNDTDGISYTKWCKDKLNLINKETDINKLKIGAICWVDLGYNIGNELRKLRPAILWRSSSDKKMWTIIPLTSKRKNDKYYFHYDLENKKLGTARIENLINISANRIREPYYSKDKIIRVSENDNDKIIEIIKKYYAFEGKQKNKSNSKVKKNREKVLT